MNPTPLLRRSARAGAWRGAAARLVVAAALAGPLGFAAATAAPVAGQMTWPSAEATADALLLAVVSGDRRELRPLFGVHADRIAPIRDDATMGEVRDAFVEGWAKGRVIEMQGADRARLLLGEVRWPYPIPMVRTADGRWTWDTRAGLAEIAARRIGRNELAAMQAARAYVDAQNEYAQVDRNGDGVAEYAQRIVSRPGSRDGLFWATAPGQPVSPLGLRIARASEGVRSGEPYQGYVYRILTGQGPAARGGALDYRVDGRMTRGFALIATPAQHGRTGINTFIVNHDGRVYSRNLGPGSREAAAGIRRFDPEPGWHPEH
jgi:hypothetical protein